MGLKRENRLRKRPEFLRAYENGRVGRHRLVTVFTYQRDDGASARFGFTVSRKLGRAVARNRLRRRLREAAREMLPDTPPGLDIVINARHPATGEKTGALRVALEETLHRALARKK